MHKNRSFSGVSLFLLLIIVSACATSPTQNQKTWLIQNARIIDGTGKPGLVGSVRVRGAIIMDVGQLTAKRGEKIVNASGYVLAPGFIDTHSHADDELRTRPLATPVTSQGISTVVFGQDGESHYPLGDFFDTWEDQPAAVNIASYSGHNTLRHKVMGENFRRHATLDEVSQMRAMLQDDLQSGALGLATGLEYDPGIFSDTDELVSLAKLTAQNGGRYASHIRSEDRHFESAINEVLVIGQRAKIPVHISHLKLAMKSLWGRSDWLLEKLDYARDIGVQVSADVYPYEYWQSTLEVLFPKRDFNSLVTAREVLDNIAPAYGLLMSEYLPEPALVGKTVAQIAKSRGRSEAQTLIDLIAEAQRYTRDNKLDDGSIINSEMVIGTSMIREDVADLIAWPFSNICTDGGLNDRHPRAVGSFPRVLRWMVRNTGYLSLEQAVHRMTLQAAENSGLEKRGIIQQGAFADLVLFDPETVDDRATPEFPQLQSVGIKQLWVNGVTVFQDGQSTAQRPGRVLRRASSQQ